MKDHKYHSEGLSLSLIQSQERVSEVVQAGNG